MAREFFVHSGCCGRHWELVYDADSGLYQLRCEVCGQKVGEGVEMTGPLLEVKCTCCEVEFTESGDREAA